jgi:hypothetical protein
MGSRMLCDQLNEEGSVSVTREYPDEANDC